MNKEFIIIYLIGVLVGIGMGLFLSLFIWQAKAQVQVSASVPLTPENCWTTYLVNKECFDECIMY